MKTIEAARIARNTVVTKFREAFPKVAHPGRRAALVSAVVVAAGVVVASDGFGSGDRSTGTQRHDAAASIDTNPTVSPEFVDETLQSFVNPRLNTLLGNFGQFRFDDYSGVVPIPENGTSISVSPDGQTIEIQRSDYVDGNTINTSASFIYKSANPDELLAVGVTTPRADRNSRQVSYTEQQLSVDSNKGQFGELYIQNGDVSKTLTTNPTSTMPLPLGHPEVSEFNQAVANAMNVINPNELKTTESVNVKMKDWQGKLSALKPNDKRIVAVSEAANVTNGSRQIEIVAFPDENPIYGISYILENEKIRTLVISKTVIGNPSVKNEYKISLDANGVDWDISRTRSENGIGARGTGQLGGSTNLSSVDKLTVAQFTAWSQGMDKIIAEVAAIK